MIGDELASGWEGALSENTLNSYRGTSLTRKRTPLGPFMVYGFAFKLTPLGIGGMFTPPIKWWRRPTL